MAVVQMIPSTMTYYGINLNAANQMGTTKALLYCTSDAYAIPTTASQYCIRIPQEGKVAVAISMLAASSLNALKVMALPGKSTDGSWGAGVGSTVYTGIGFTTPGISTAVNTLYIFPLPDSGRFAQQSTVNTGYNTVTLQLEGSTAVGTTGSTTLATVATTIAMYCFQMPY